MPAFALSKVLSSFSSIEVSSGCIPIQHRQLQPHALLVFPHLSEQGSPLVNHALTSSSHRMALFTAVRKKGQMFHLKSNYCTTMLKILFFLKIALVVDKNILTLATLLSKPLPMPFPVERMNKNMRLKIFTL